MKTKIYYATPYDEIKLSKHPKPHENCISVEEFEIVKIHPDGLIEVINNVYGG